MRRIVVLACGSLLLLVGCGGSQVPSGDVALVKDAPAGSISRGEFDRWMRVAEASSDDPARARRQAMQFLISSRWIAGQARQEGISVTDAEVQAALDRQIKESFPKDGQLERFLAERNMTRSELLFRTRVNLLAGRLRERATTTPPTPTEKQIEDFYRENQRRFGQPASREVQIITTKNPAKAIRARQLIRDGASFASVARRYSEDKTTAAQGGRATISFGRIVGRDLERAVFSAPVGQLEGPVQGGFVYYVFKVLKANPSTRQSLSEARPLVEELLVSELKRNQVSDYLKEMEARWRPRTLCAPGYRIADCSS